MAKKVLEASGGSKVKKAPAAKKGATAKKVSAAKKKPAAKSVFTVKPVRAKAVKVPLSEIEKEKKAIEARGYIVKKIYITSDVRIPRGLKLKGTSITFSYIRPDGLFVDSILDVPDVPIPPERRSPYGIFKGPPPPGGYGKILDMKAVMR